MPQNSRALIAIIGMFPPPTTGAAKNNQLLLDDLTSHGAKVERLSTSGRGTAHRRHIYYHLERFALNLAVTTRLLGLIGKGGTFYIVPDGGLGMAYSLAHIVLGQLFFDRLVIHHRSFLYIERPTWLMATIAWMSRSKATHIFLSDRMGDCFEHAYGVVRRITVSNAHYVIDEIAPPASSNTDRYVIGHLSSLCEAKGVYDVIAVFDRLARSGVDVELQLAGKPVDTEVRRRIEQLQAAWPGRVLYWGPVYGEAKRRFYRGLDVFLFPSRHPQEAQPNVIFEALAAGVPVLATPRACIPDMLPGQRGDTSPTERAFVDWCVAELEARASVDQSQHHDFTEELRRDCKEAQRAYLHLRELLLSG